MAAPNLASRPTTGSGQLLDARKVKDNNFPTGDYPIGRGYLFKCDVLHCNGHYRAKCDFARHMRDDHDRFAPIPTGHTLYTAAKPWGGFTITEVDATNEVWRARLSPIDQNNRFEGKMVRQNDWSQLSAAGKKAKKIPATAPTIATPQTLATSAQGPSVASQASASQASDNDQPCGSDQPSGNDQTSVDDQDPSFDSKLIDPVFRVAPPVVPGQTASSSSTQAAQASVDATGRNAPQSTFTRADFEDGLASFGTHPRRNTPRDPAAAREARPVIVNNHVTAPNSPTPPLPAGVYESRIHMEAELRSRTTNTPIDQVTFTWAELEAIRTRPVGRPWAAMVPPPDATPARARSASAESSESEDKWATDQVYRRMNPGPVPDDLIKKCPVLYGNMSNTRRTFAQPSTAPPTYAEHETSQLRADNNFGQAPKKAAPKAAPAKAQPKKKVTKAKEDTKKSDAKKGAGTKTKAKPKGKKGTAAKDDGGSDKEKLNDEEDKESSSSDFESDPAHWSTDSEKHYPKYSPFNACK